MVNFSKHVNFQRCEKWTERGQLDPFKLIKIN